MTEPSTPTPQRATESPSGDKAGKAGEAGGSLFVRDGDRYLPTEFSRGPWTGDALHGGPTSALLAHLCETAPGAPGQAPMHPARLTVELLSAVPLAPLEARVEVVRDGKRVRLIEAELWAGSRRVAAARMSQIRMKNVELPADTERRGGAMQVDVTAPAASIRSTPLAASDTVAFHSHSTEHRFPRGNWIDREPAFDWIRLLVPLLPDVALTPLVRVAAAADFPNGISAPLPFEDWLYINPDLSIHLHRLPGDEWVGLDATCRIQPTGVGTSEAQLYDLGGHLGHCHQSLLIDNHRG